MPGLLPAGLWPWLRGWLNRFGRAAGGLITRLEQAPEIQALRQWAGRSPRLTLVLGGLALLVTAMLVTVLAGGLTFLAGTWEERRHASEIYRNLAWLFGGLVAGGVGLYGIYLAGIRTRAADVQARVAQESHLTDLFTKAIEQLGSTELALRLGAIYALERIARDSARDHWPIMETLTAFVRENAPWPPSKDWQLPEQVPEGQEPKPRADIQAILTVLGRRNRAHEEGKFLRLNLERTDLRGADLFLASFEYASLVEAHLEGAALTSACLEHIDLFAAHLEGACLTGTRLVRSFLWGAHITRGALYDWQLTNVYGADEIIWVDPPASEA